MPATKRVAEPTEKGTHRIAHTPGPWTVKDTEHEIQIRAEAEFCTVAKMLKQDIAPRGAASPEGAAALAEACADANLLAASPALLAACQFAHSVITANGVFETSERLAIKKLEAAIALAKGGAK